MHIIFTVWTRVESTERFPLMYYSSTILSIWSIWFHKQFQELETEWGKRNYIDFESKQRSISEHFEKGRGKTTKLFDFFLLSLEVWSEKVFFWEIGTRFKEKNLTLRAETVNPAVVVPTPVVSTDRGDILLANFRISDFPVPGSPTRSRCNSGLTLAPSSPPLPTPPARTTAKHSLTR